jgi:hypothetical protein
LSKTNTINTDRKIIKILGKTYSVEQVQQSPLKINETYSGLIEYSTQTIYIDKDIPRENKEETLLHECIHGIDYHLALGLSEKQVVRLSTAIYQLINENDITFNV